MLIEKGLVIKLEKLTKNGIVKSIAWVNTQSKLACSSCQVESTCGSGILEKYLAGKVFVSKIDNCLAAKVGDEVEIAIPKSSVTKASLMVYLLPLFMFFSGALLGDYIDSTEKLSILFSFIGLALGVFFFRIYNRQLINDENYQPRMISKISKQIDAEVFSSIQVKNIE